jgi:hypothetical protein
VKRAYRRKRAGRTKKIWTKKKARSTKKKKKKARQKSKDNTFAKFKWLFLLKDTMPAQSPRYLCKQPQRNQVEEIGRRKKRKKEKKNQYHAIHRES